MHSFEVSLGYESVDRTTFSTWLPRFIENILRSTLSYPNETSKECIQFLITDADEVCRSSKISVNLIIIIVFL